MTPTEFKQTPRYQAYSAACQALDHAAQARIMQEGLEATVGEEKALWQRCQETHRWTTLYFQQPNAQQGWVELEEVLASPPSEEWARTDVIIRALGMYLLTQQADMWATIFPKLRPHLRLIKRSWAYYYYVAMLRLRQGRWRLAYKASMRSVAYYQETYPDSKSPFRVHMYVLRAMAAIACGHLDRAKEDVERAAMIEAGYDRNFVEPYGLHLAQAELALAQGCCQEARMALQEGMARATTAQHKPRPHNFVEYDLAAARIARAEGHRTSFEYFCEQALDRCLKWKLRLSEPRVRAVMAGAER